MKKIVSTFAIAGALVLVGGTAANAADETVTPQGQCSGSNVVYQSSSSAGAFQRASGDNSAVSGNAGVVLSISTSTTYGVSGSMSASGTVSAEAVVASVSATVGTTVGTSKSGTTSASGAWQVPADWGIGQLEIGAIKFNGVTRQYLENSNCVLVEQGSRSFDIPTASWHFQQSRIS